MLPAEVEQHGAQAAILLGHIRFRCQAPGPSRVQAQGVWWWRVSLEDLAEETGLSVRGVRTALKALGNAVAAKHFKPLSNRSLSYSVTTHQNGAELPFVEIDKWTDQPVVVSDISSGENDTSICQKRHLHLSKSTDVLPIEKLEKGEKAALTQARTDQTRNGSRQLTPPTEISIEPPKRACTRYPHSDPCGTCGSDNRALEAWKQHGQHQLSALQREVNQMERQEGWAEDNDQRRELGQQIKALRWQRRDWIVALRAEGVAV